MPPIGKFVLALLRVLVLGAVCGILWWLFDFLALPAPFAYISRGVIACLAAFGTIWILLDLAGISAWTGGPPPA